MKTKKMLNRFLSMFLVVLMVFSITEIPTLAYADETEEDVAGIMFISNKKPCKGCFAPLMRLTALTGLFF